MKILMVGLYEEIEFMPQFYEFLNSIRRFSLPIIEGEEKDNSKFIYIDNYKFDRLDQQLIEYIRSLNNLDYFYTRGIDERFTNTKYYNIKTKEYEHGNKNVINETLIINYDDIVDDLYYKRYIYDDK
jgi:hypothetical protein